MVPLRKKVLKHGTPKPNNYKIYKSGVGNGRSHPTLRAAATAASAESWQRPSLRDLAQMLEWKTQSTRVHVPNSTSKWEFPKIGDPNMVP